MKKNIVRLKIQVEDIPGKVWCGDYWLSLDLKEKLQTLGHNVKIDYYSKRNAVENTIVNIVFRGQTNMTVFSPAILNVLYLYSHPDMISLNEMKKYDCVCTSSKNICEKINRDKLPFTNAYYIPQFTNTKKFHNKYNETFKTKVLFIANNIRKEREELLEFLLSKNAPVSVYGMRWDECSTPVNVISEVVDNNILNEYYSSADIVLNDTWIDMRENNIISNRIFDVTACKGFIISDYIPEIETIYGDSVPMFKTKEECLELINYYLLHPEERKQKAEKAHEITMNNFTSEIIAGMFDKVIKENLNKKTFIKKYLKSFKIYLFSLPNKLFSIKNQYCSGKIYKTFTLLGIKIKFRNLRKENVELEKRVYVLEQKVKKLTEV